MARALKVAIFNGVQDLEKIEESQIVSILNYLNTQKQSFENLGHFSPAQLEF